jgi:low affinity Fe/Cu permease
MKEAFRRFAGAISTLAGSPSAFIGAVVILLAWAFSGPLFHYSDTWQLTINTGTTIVTFLMVFLIQNTQNREAKALNLKLDEIIHALHEARNEMIDLENASDDQLDRVENEFHELSVEVQEGVAEAEAQVAQKTTR